MYQQAVYHGARGDGAKAREILASFMAETRPTARSRNDLRNFIRTEPDFQAHLEGEGWAELTTDEALGEEKPGG